MKTFQQWISLEETYKPEEVRKVIVNSLCLLWGFKPGMQFERDFSRVIDCLISKYNRNPHANISDFVASTVNSCGGITG